MKLKGFREDVEEQAKIDLSRKLSDSMACVVDFDMPSGGDSISNYRQRIQGIKS